jgi:hypothetical protein
MKRCTRTSLAVEAKKKEVRERRLSASHRLEQTMQKLFPLYSIIAGGDEGHGIGVRMNVRAST